MMFLFLFCYDHSLVFDKKHVHGKIKKILELINSKRIVQSNEANFSTICFPDIPSFDPPLNMDNSYTSTNCSNSFIKFPWNFPNGKREWISFISNLSIPSKFNPKIHTLHFNFQITPKYLARPWDDEFPAGPEGRFWINNKLIGSIDQFHNGADIPEFSTSSDPLTVQLRIFTGRCNSSHILDRFGLSIIHQETEALFHRIRFYSDILTQLKEDNPDSFKLLSILDETIRLLDIRDLNGPIPLSNIRIHDPDNQQFYASVSKALTFIDKSILEEFPSHSESDPTVSIIGYSHLDTCWEWPYSILHHKSANTACSMLHLMNHPPVIDPISHTKKNAEWKFLATSAQHYRWIEEDDHDLYAKIMKEKRWIVDGVSWVEMETMLSSGESLVRQIVNGINYFEKNGKKQTTLFLPDCFGFTASLPQILRLAGIDSFVTSKISWSEYTTFPYDTFVWKGIDGSEVLAHYISTPSSWSYQTSTYTGTSTAYEIIGTYKAYKQKDILPTTSLHTSGNGDGGGGITEEMVWNLNLIYNLPKIQDVPRVTFPTLEELFNTIRAQKKHLPIWDDELYLEYHRGTLTTQEEVKRLNRELEAYLHSCEWLLTISLTLFKDSDKQLLRCKKQISEIWHKVMKFQFHDALPGTSVNEANSDILSEGVELKFQFKLIEDELASFISRHIRTVTVPDSTIIFNTLSHQRKFDGILIPSGGWAVLYSTNTTNLIDQSITTFYQIPVENNEQFIPENRSEYLIMDLSHDEHFITRFTSEKRNKNEIDLENRTFETSSLYITFNEKWEICSIISKKNKRELLSGPIHFEFYEDRPLNWPAWDIQLYHKEMELLGPKYVSHYIDSEGNLNVKLEIPDGNYSDEYADKTEIYEKIRFNQEIDAFDIDVTVNWTQHDKLLKIAIPTTIRARKAKYGIQFGYIERPTHSNTERDMAKFEVCGRWADFSDATGGISVTSDVKSGWDIHDNTIRLSLLKAPMQTDQWADFGIRKFTVRIMINLPIIDTIKLSDELNYPIISTQYIQPMTPIDVSNSVSPVAEFVSSSDPYVIISCLKPAENGKGFIARIYETGGGWRKSEISFPLLESIYYSPKLVNLLEKEIENNLKLSKIDGPSLRFEVNLNAFEIITVFIEESTSALLKKTLM